MPVQQIRNIFLKNCKYLEFFLSGGHAILVSSTKGKQIKEKAFQDNGFFKMEEEKMKQKKEKGER